MGFGDRAGDVETEAGPGFAEVPRTRPNFSKISLVLGGDPPAVVGDLHGHVAVHRRRPHLDR